MTGLGIYMGMKACAKGVWGSDSLTGEKVVMQGFSKVAINTAHHLLKEDAHLVVTDIYEKALNRARDLGIRVVEADSIYDLKCDIFAPCALWGALNEETIPRLKCRVVAGAANNQLMTEGDGEALHRAGILYEPDYVTNAGGIINAASEIDMVYNPDRAREKTERIYDIIGKVIDTARKEEVSTAHAADQLSERRIAPVRAMRRIYRAD